MCIDLTKCSSLPASNKLGSDKHAPVPTSRAGLKSHCLVGQIFEPEAPAGVLEENLFSGVSSRELSIFRTPPASSPQWTFQISVLSIYGSC